MENLEVLVPVPHEMVPEVVQFVIERQSMSPTQVSHVPSNAVVTRCEVHGQGMWTEDELRRLHDNRLLDKPMLLSLLDHVAASRGEQVTYGELCSALYPDLSSDEASDQLRPVLGWLSKMAKKELGTIRLPMYRAEYPNLDPGDRYRYAMPLTIADWWKDIRSR